MSDRHVGAACALRACGDACLEPGCECECHEVPSGIRPASDVVVVSTVMPYPSRPPTTQAVGSALKREGFGRSQLSGASYRIAGYAVRKCRTQPDAVDVRWYPDSREATSPDVYTDIEPKRTRMLLRYADRLLAQGFRSQVHGDRVIVYGRLVRRS